MRGLLLKDWYLMKKHCKLYLLSVAMFLTASLFSENMFFAIYPCMVSVLLPVSLYSFDERSGWNVYSRTMPYRPADIVSAKFLIGLFCQLFVSVLFVLLQGGKLVYTHSFSAPAVVNYLAFLAIGFCCASLYLPLVFKLGVEKSRMAYMALIVIMCVAGVVAEPFAQATLLIALPVALLIYIGSWRLSILFYTNREVTA